MSHSSISPISLSTAATRRLPRWILFIICTIYGLAGLFGRDPWKHNDATGFGVIWNMANGTLHDWLLPNIAGRPFDHDGPLMFWLGAFMVKLFGETIGGANAARLATAICFFSSCILLWRSTYLLGRRSEAQPYAFAFGGQPHAHDYGRALADGALLIFLACIGLAQHSHETTAGLAQMALVTLFLYGTVRSFDKFTQGIICCGIALGGLVLASGIVVPIILWLTLFFSARLSKDFAGKRLAITALPLGLAIAAIWPLLAITLTTRSPLAWHHLEAWLIHDISRFNGPSLQALGYTVRNLVPYAWPLWPLAAWAVISWRTQWRSPHIVLPLSLISAFLALIFFQGVGDDILFMLLIPPLALLAAFSLPTLTRSVGNAIDWFALMASTLLAGFIWLVWNAQITHIPQQTAANFYRLLPGFTANFRWQEMVFALIVSCGWLLVVRWRLSRAPKVIWRSVVISAAGTTVVWVLMMTLWLPAINYAKTYSDVAMALVKAMPKQYTCIRPSRMGNPQLASFIYFTQLRFSETRSDCDVLLDHETNKHAKFNRSISPQQWYLIWEGRRPADRDERFRLYIAHNKTQ